MPFYALQEKHKGDYEQADAQIAAIARVHDFAIATRNIKDFENCGLRLINPFDGGSNKS